MHGTINIKCLSNLRMRKNGFITVFITVLPKLVLLASKDNHGFSHPCLCTYVNIEWQDDRDPKFKTISELTLDSYEYIPVAYTTMHCMI